MCGIVGYLGERPSLPILLDGLKRLEYRGYDSAGVALQANGCIELRKRAGKVAELEKNCNGFSPTATQGIGHTRWATHGEPTDINAHPHLDCSGTIAVIHNGVIENYKTLRKRLELSGHKLSSATDTEVLAHLFEEYYQQCGDLADAIRQALLQVEGTYGMVVMSTHQPELLIAARKGSPLVIGLGENEAIVASDAAALVQYTRKVIYLDDGEIAIVSKGNTVTRTLDNVEVEKEICHIAFDVEQIEKGGYPHFMLKEIHEQPDTILNALRGRIQPENGEIKLGGVHDIMDKLAAAKRIIMIGCGTSWHAGLVGEYMIEQMANIPVEVEYASEFRYRNPVVTPDDVVIAITQSGETADTLAALREAKKRGATALGIVNVVGSTVAREADRGIYAHAGPEIGVASTKAFTSQLTVLALLSILLARQRDMSKDEARVLGRELASLPAKVNKILQDTSVIRTIAGEFKSAEHFLYLGRGANFPVALEGALKLKEISYVHAEGYPAAEMKHGPIALIDNNMPVVFIAPRDATHEKIVSNMEEVRARKGRIIAVANDDDEDINYLAEYVIRVPRTYGFFGPILNVVPLQLLSYYIAVARGTNVDQPRNLAKSVTVE